MRGKIKHVNKNLCAKIPYILMDFTYFPSTASVYFHALLNAIWSKALCEYNCLHVS